MATGGDKIAEPQVVLDYMGRYTHRVAISNNRLLDIEKALQALESSFREWFPGFRPTEAEAQGRQGAA
jgi:hypothetical protein